MEDKDLIEELGKRDPNSRDNIYKKAQEKDQKPTNIQASMVLDDSDSIIAKEDRLQRHQLAEIIAEQIATNQKFHTYSIDGAWGSGKTILMKWVKEELETKYKEEVLIEWFDPWKYEAIKNITFPLIEQLKSKATGKDFDKKITKVLLGAILIGGSAVTIKALGVKAYLEYLAKIPIDKIKGNLQSEFKTLTKLQEDFQELVDYILDEKSPKPKKLVFLIDDLDRCSPENVVLLLESIKNFLRTERTCFVFAIDKRVVSQGINHKYGSRTEIDGSEYLEKIIQFSFEIPSDPKNYSTQFLKLYQSEITSEGYNLTFVPELFKIANVKSIRLMKKVFNRYIITDRLGNKIHPHFRVDILFFLTFIYEIFPAFYHFIQEAGPYEFLILIKKFYWIDTRTNKQFPDTPGVFQKFVIDFEDAPKILRVVNTFLDTVPGIGSEQGQKEFNEKISQCLDIFSKYGT